jgi:hypothetical protein
MKKLFTVKEGPEVGTYMIYKNGIKFMYIKLIGDSDKNKGFINQMVESLNYIK